MRIIAIQAATLWWREITRFRRQRSVIIGSLLQPLIFWVLIGWGFRASFRPSGMPAGIDYVQYFYPGVIMLVLLFTAIFATIQTVEDRQEGFLQGVLVAPVSRATVVFGQALGGTTLALAQGLIFLLLAPLAGITLSFAAVAVTAAMMAVTAFALTSIGLMIAWRIESTRGFHLIMNSILVPIWFLSGAFFPANGAPPWLGWIMRLNPLTYQMAALRKGLYLAYPATLTGGLPRFALTVPIAIGFAIVAFVMATVVAQRSVTV
ncbi:MAG TPA: ABC transporter permease [Candidatus Binataceae bacterium]|nr:ABC transporter permease [Candidatus Binataceae bacterium]